MYVTLSHCWGGHSPMTTTTDTLPARIQGIPLQSLPRTFQDAVIIARDLGVQYLWIDSLCILQDSADDWEREAARMSTIYANCYVMIAADASSNCDGGCFPPAEGPPVQASHATPIQGLSGRRSKVLCEVCHRLYDCNNDWGPYPLDKRGWTLQERILAPRTLHFGQSEVGWECASRRACECQSVPTQLDTDSRWKAHLLNLPAASGQDPEPRSGVPDPQKQWIWSNIVEEFTTNRSLTYESDILPALAGLARTMSPAAGDDYMCGLWRDKLSGFLTWTPASSNGKRHKQHYAPSWSWASVIGPI
ncbi:HET-domain-containing protein, partial [Thozetella sp. PMI_491]